MPKSRQSVSPTLVWSLCSNFDENRFEIATSDDSELTTRLTTRTKLKPESTTLRSGNLHRGNGSIDTVHVGSFPAISCNPVGEAAAIEFTFLGDPKGSFKKTITLPNESNDPAYHHEETSVSPAQQPPHFQNFPQFPKWNQIALV